MPFGLCNAPVIFQRLMDAVLAGLKWSTCLVYIDDIVIPGKMFQALFTHLFERLKGARLTLKPKKCHLCLQIVKFLRHIVSADGIQTDPQKTEKLSN